MRHGDQLCLFVQKPLKRLYIERLVIAQGNMPQYGFLTRTEHLPRHDIGMVFHGTHDNLVALMDAGLSKTKRQGVNTIRRALGEDNLVTTLRADECSHGLTRLLVFHRRYLAQVVHSPVDITVPPAIRLLYGVYHHLRLLTRRGIIQIHQLPSVYPLFQYRKIFSSHFI